MKRILNFTLFMCLVLNAQAQKLEFSIQANTGVSFFRGNGTQSISNINEAADAANNYTNNQYGNIQAATYGFGVDLKLVIVNHFLIGTQAGYENLRSKINLQTVDRSLKAVPFDYIYIEQPKGGQTILDNQFVNINPYLGYRIYVKKITLDFTVGQDIGISKQRQEHGSTATTDGKTVTTEKDRGKLTFNDLRWRYEIKAMYRRFGLSAGYSRGFTDYNQGMVTTPAPGMAYTPGRTYVVYSNVFRAGLSYRIY